MAVQAFSIRAAQKNSLSLCMAIMTAIAAITLWTPRAYAQGVGIGVSNPVNILDVEGNMVIGSGYSGTNSAPTNGLLIEGLVGIGTTSPNSLFHVSGEGTFGDGFAPVAGNGVNHLNLLVGASGNGGTNGISFWENDTPFGMKFGYDGTGFGDENALRIYNDADNALFSFENGGEMGIGTTAPAALIHISYNLGDNPAGNYGLLVENTSGEAELRLAPGGTGSDFTISANNDGSRFRIYENATERFRISTTETWFYDDNDLQAIIRSDASAQNDDGWSTATVDYGEFMEKLDPQEHLAIFEVVGVKNGKVTKNTDGASLIMITTTDGGLRGGNPIYDPSNTYASREEDPDWLATAFIGQVPVLVEGEVQPGDFIIPSGKHDGKAKAISKENITLAQFNQLIGIAMESAANPKYEQADKSGYGNSEWKEAVYEINNRKPNGYHVINVAVNVNFGLPSGLFAKINDHLATLENQNRSGAAAIRELNDELGKIKATLEEIKLYALPRTEK